MVSIFSFFGCKQEPDVPQIPIETENPLSTKLTVTAYPGMNYISWTPVVNAENYTLFIHEGDVCINSKKFNKTEPLFYIDTEIKNNVKYNYLVEVEHSESSKSFFSDKVSTQAIVPEYYEKALNLVEYERPKGNRNFIISPNNIHIAKHNNDKISVSFPSKAYLNYDLFLTVDNEYETLEEFNIHENLRDNAHNDVILYTNFLVTQAGTYNARIIAKSENELFGDSDVITSTQSVHVKKLNGTGGEIISAKYTSYDWIDLKVSCFELENGTKAPVTYYRLYRSEVGSRDFTEISGSIYYNEDDNTYSMSDYTEDNTKDYVYTLVVTDGQLYAGTSSKKTVESYVPRKRTAFFYNEYGNSIDEIKVIEDSDYYWDHIYLPSIPEREGCIAYWKDDNGETYEPNTYYQLDDELTSFYREYQRNASFYNEYSNYIDSTTVSYDAYDSYWNEIQLPSITEKEGYTSYWKDDYGKTYDPNSYVFLEKESTTFTIYYEIIQRTANFYHNTGYLLNSITLSYDSSDPHWYYISLPEITEQEGYIAYWRDDYGNYFSPNTNICLENKSTNFTIYYEPLTRTAYFYNEYDNLINSITVTHGSRIDWNSIQLPLITEKEGYTSYWCKDDGQTYEANTYVSLYNESTTFTIHYEPKPRTANFYDEYGYYFDSRTVIYSNSESWNYIQLPSITEKEGYTAYWKDDNGTLYSPNNYYTLEKESTSFTIYYEPKPRTATFYDENRSYFDSTTVTYDATNSEWNGIQLPSITEKEGYTAYWKDDNGTFYSPNSYVFLEKEFTTFYIGYLLDSYTVEYLSDSYATSFYCEAGKTYSVYWLDSFQGSQELSDLMTQQGISGEPVDIKVSIYSADGTQTVCTEMDSGFDTPQTFTANTTGDFYIEVLPYGSGNTGYFAYSIIEN